MGDWFRCADLVVAKAGPGTIAEATCCGAALVLTSHLPGQEKGNAEFVVAGGAGRYAPNLGQLLREVTALRGDPVALDAMRAASARLSRPGAASEIAALLAGVVDESRPNAAARPRIVPGPDRSESEESEGTFIDNPLSGERIMIRQSGRETGGRLVSWELFLAPGGRVPSRHPHPRQEESFTVWAG